MDDFRQSTAPARRSRRLTSGRRLLGLIAVLALLALLPASAFASSDDAASQQHPDATFALALDVTSDDAPPVDSGPVADSPAPADSLPADPVPPSDPAPAPSDPAPAPSDPAPAPVDPAPSEPAPAPTEPAPAEPAPAPTTDPVPAEPAPPTEDQVPPADPAPRESRAPAPKQPSEERTAPPAALVAPLPVSAGPVADASGNPANAAATAAPEPPRSADEGVASQGKVVRAALRRLGIGTIAAPAAVAVASTDSAAPAPACTPIGTVGVGSSAQTPGGIAVRSVVRPHRAGGEPPLVRGPPAPRDSPSSPMAAAGSGGVAAGGVSGERHGAVLADQIVLASADGESAVATDCCDHVAPAPANAAARAPPVA